MHGSKQVAGSHRGLGASGAPMSQVRSNVVAIVDDDEDVRDVISALFELCGHDVETYKSGTEFLQDAVLDRLACLVVDLKMPEMTGLELVAELERRGVAIPTVLITGSHEASVRAQAAASGIMTVMQKPISAQQLVRFVAFSVH
ncbi:MAG: response regulator [Rhodopila sp.]|nr:response regulator [Rhodopila sp.]